MGCRKLTYYRTSTETLKVLTGRALESEKVVQGFISVDPLAAQFPHQSPYSAMNDNPIYFVDPDGRSGVAYKTNEKSKKSGKPIVKVVSNVFIFGKGATEANRELIQANANKNFNNDGDFFSATIDGEEFEVQFEFNVSIINESDVDSKLVEGGYGNLNAENNFFEIRDDIDVAGITLSGSGDFPGGNAGVLKTSELGNRTPEHEFNHGFGGTNKDTEDPNDETKFSENDISVQSKNSKNPSNRKVTQENINAIFKNVSFNGKNKTNVGNARPDLFDKENGSRRVPQY